MRRFLLTMALLFSVTGVVLADDADKAKADKAKAAAKDATTVSLAELEGQVDANPKDTQIIAKYFSKAAVTIRSTARSKPDEAEATLKAVKTRLEKTLASTEDADAKKSIESMLKSLSTLERTIESGRKLVELIGKDAAPLDVETWVNGKSLTDSDLKGKVVLLDFWAVWCGPCIATFPHLREWNEKYADKGLVIIGLTRYYKNYEWDAAAGRLKRAQSALTPEAEQEMLKQFAAHHNLHHRFAVQSNDSKTSDFYGVTGIPHVVLIDRTGKIRLMRVGSGEQNAKDISEMLEKLIAAEPTATGG